MLLMNKMDWKIERWVGKRWRVWKYWGGYRRRGYNPIGNVLGSLVIQMLIYIIYMRKGKSSRCGILILLYKSFYRKQAYLNFKDTQ